MIKYTTEDIQDAYTRSSPKVQEILDSDWVAESAAQIAREEDLRVDKVDTLIRIIGLTLLNIVAIPKFSKLLESELEISSEKAKTVAQGADDLVFQRVRRIIKGEDKVNAQVEIAKEESREEVVELMDNIDDQKEKNLSFKDKFNKVVVKKVKKREIDPYRESID